MTVVFLDPAKEELKEAVACYDRQREGLGDEFAAEAAATIDRIAASPGAGSPLAPGIRHAEPTAFLTVWSTPFEVRT